MTQKITGAYLVCLIQKILGTENVKSNLCFNFRIQFGFRTENPSQKSPTEWILLWILQNYSQPTKKEISWNIFFRLLNFNFSHLLHIQLECLDELVIDLINCLAFWWRNSYHIIRDFTEVGTLFQILHRRGRLSLQRFLTKNHFSLGQTFSNSII